MSTGDLLSDVPVEKAPDINSNVFSDRTSSVDSLIERFSSYSASMNRTSLAASPELFMLEQNEQNKNARRSGARAKAHVKSFRTSFLGATAIAKPLTIAQRATAYLSRPFTAVPPRVSTNPMFGKVGVVGMQNDTDEERGSCWLLSRAICMDEPELMQKQMHLLGAKTVTELVNDHERPGNNRASANLAFSEMKAGNAENNMGNNVVEVNRMLGQFISRHGTGQVDTGRFNSIVFVICARFGCKNCVEVLLDEDWRADISPDYSNNYAVRLASKNGHLGVVNLLLSDARIDPSAVSNVAVRHACANGHIEVVKRLLYDSRVNPSSLLMVACERGHRELVKVLLQCGRVNPTEHNNKALLVACDKGNRSIVKLLLADARCNAGKDPTEFLFYIACRVGDVSTVKHLLATGDVDPSAFENRAVKDASCNGHVSVVQLLLQHICASNVDPCAGDNYAFKRACENGHIDVVELLLLDGRVDAAADGNMALRKACEWGHLEIVQLLLEESNVDPSADNNSSIQDASWRGHLGIVKLLLNHERVNPAANKNSALHKACAQGHLDIVKLLLQDIRVDPAGCLLSVIQVAPFYGDIGVRAELVRIILQDERVDPLADDSHALTLACGKQIVEVVKVLLEDPRVNVTAAALHAADLQSDTDVVALLFKQPNVFDLRELWLRKNVDGASNGAIAQELCRIDTGAVVNMLLAVKRAQPAWVGGRVSDVLRDVAAEWLPFGVRSSSS